MPDLTPLDGSTIFTTQRLRCRKWRPDDLDNIFNIYSDPEGARWVGDGKPTTRDRCEKWLEVTARNYTTRGYGMYALDHRTNNTTLGFCGLIHPDNQIDAEIKYAIRRSHWGQGLATEAATALMTYATQTLCLTKIIATVAPENIASHKVLTNAGLSFTKEQPDELGEIDHLYEWTK